MNLGQHGEQNDGAVTVWAELAQLAREYRIATEYYDWQGRQTQVSAAALRAVLAAFEVDASSPAACRAALAAHRRAQAVRPLPPCVIVRRNRGPATVEIRVHASRGVRPLVWMVLEDGDHRHDVTLLRTEPNYLDEEQPLDRSGLPELARHVYALPTALPLGWHTLYAQMGDTVHQTLVAVAPERLTDRPGPGGPATDRRAWGYTLQLQALRSRRSWGMGDLSDLSDLADLAGHDLGAGFLVVNPLHGSNGVAPVDPSPYLPATRRFPDPVYLRVEAVPEYAYAPTALREQVEELASDLRKLNVSGEQIDRDRVWEAKERALRMLFRLPRTAGRAAAYRAYRRREGRALRSHATWLALAARHGADTGIWPASLQRPDAPAVAEFSRVEAGEVDFHSWLQWLLDEQLAAVRAHCREAGMVYGIFHDLAVGAQAHGADTWADAAVYARGVTVGAPADEFNQMGQDWASRPWRPDRLAEAGYQPYRQMLAGVLRHADGLRMDHVMSLFRLWWVPAGSPPSAGTYVHYDHDAMLAVLTLEAHRAGAMIVGEDLGTVEPQVRAALADRGVYGTNVLWFERDEHGAPLPPSRWRETCLAAVTTHDLPPAAASLTGSHLDLRAELGLLTRPLDQEKELDRAAVESWLDQLRRLGLLRRGAGEQETVEALHRFLAWTPARMIGVYLPDAVGDQRPHNLPGTSGDTYPNWRLPLADGQGRPVLLDDLATHPRVRSLARVLRTLA
ncbi:MAG TPA: 4-alpha-glucanotransferase [Actinocrinis sp.]|nr:4-alpha-glucanotransferase [Actinocrinis sp.]